MPPVVLQKSILSSTCPVPLALGARELPAREGCRAIAHRTKFGPPTLGCISRESWERSGLHVAGAVGAVAGEEVAALAVAAVAGRRTPSRTHRTAAMRRGRFTENTRQACHSQPPHQYPYIYGSWRQAESHANPVPCVACDIFAFTDTRESDVASASFTFQCRYAIRPCLLEIGVSCCKASAGVATQEALGMQPDTATKHTSPKCECGRPHLTDRQAELLALRAAGLTRREIAVRLMISVRTVDDHFMMIASRTGVHDSIELNSLAHAFGILVAGVPPSLTEKRCWGP